MDERLPRRMAQRGPFWLAHRDHPGAYDYFFDVVDGSKSFLRPNWAGHGPSSLFLQASNN